MKLKSFIAPLTMFLFLAQPARADNFFTECRFHWGAGGANAALMNEIDYMTAWAGSGESFNLGSFFTNCKNKDKTPVIIAYVIAFTARRDWGLQDCNVDTPSLCQRGADYIRDSLQRILSQYAKYAKGAAQSFGTTDPMIWCMEPDYTQYAENSQGAGKLLPAEAGAFMNRILDTIHAYCPNAVFSMDISPWKDTTFQKTWYAAMNINRFAFINTSGGQSTPGSTFISNTGRGCPTWAWVYKTFGTPMIADADYGVAGSPTAFIAAWQDSATLTARINDGVIAVAHSRTPDSLVTEIIAVRPKLPAPPKCPAGNSVKFPYTAHNGASYFEGIPASGLVELIDLSGRVVCAKQYSQKDNAWNAWRGDGKLERTGAYIIRLRGNNQTAQKVVVFIK